METDVLRRVLGTLAGIVLAVVITSLWEMTAHYLMPPPPTRLDVAPGAPTLALVIVGYGVATFLGALTAARLARVDWAALIVGGLMAASVIALVVMMPHPLWFLALSLAVVGVGSTLAQWTSQRMSGGSAPLSSVVE
ncbi:MAG: putative MFS family arabinose efflux permease [Brevundimonas sp.]|jgi:predicted MFS family arabinose efflux permease